VKGTSYLGLCAYYHRSHFGSRAQFVKLCNGTVNYHAIHKDFCIKNLLLTNATTAVGLVVAQTVRIHGIFRAVCFI